MLLAFVLSDFSEPVADGVDRTGHYCRVEEIH